MIIQVDLTSDIPIYQQIRDSIVLGIGKGELQAGENLPTVRQLAEDLGINPMTVNKAYQLLKSEGMIVVDRRIGTRVRESKEDIIPSDYRKRVELLLAEGVSKTGDREGFKKEILKILEGLT